MSSEDKQPYSDKINAVIADLIKIPPGPKKSYRLIQLSTWMRFSSNPIMWQFASIVGFLSYARCRHGNVRLSQLDHDIAAMSLADLRINDILKVLYSESRDVPEFDDLIGEGTDVDDLQYAANLARYLLWVAPVTLGVSKRGKTKRLIRAKLHMGYHVLTLRAEEGTAAPRSFSTFRNDWTKTRNAAAFLYVNAYHSKLDLDIHPRASDYAGLIDDIANRPAELEEFLGQAYWAGQRLLRRLPAKARRGMTLPTFPDDFQPIRITRVKLDARVDEVLKDYDPNVYEFEENLS